MVFALALQLIVHTIMCIKLAELESLIYCTCLLQLQINASLRSPSHTFLRSLTIFNSVIIQFFFFPVFLFLQELCFPFFLFIIQSLLSCFLYIALLHLSSFCLLYYPYIYSFSILRFASLSCISLSDFFSRFCATFFSSSLYSTFWHLCLSPHVFNIFHPSLCLRGGSFKENWA